MIEPKSGQHAIGQCDCGFFHDQLMTTECARELFDQFHEMAVRDRGNDEYLRQMCIGDAEQRDFSPTTQSVPRNTPADLFCASTSASIFFAS